MPWWFDHDTLSSNRFPTAVLSLAASRASETFFNNSSLWTFSPCCSITFLPNVILALTEEFKFEVCVRVCVCVTPPKHETAKLL